jgi:PspA associated protein B
VGFLDTLFGRTKPVQPDLDRLFALPSAAMTLMASTTFTPTGVGSVCFRPMEGRAFSDVEADIRQLLDADADKTMPVEVTSDSYGFTWMVVREPADQFEALVTNLHAVNSTLADNGFGPSLLCSLVTFADDKSRRLAIVYLYKRGTFYPFAPLTGERRDSALELQIRAAIEGDLMLETDLERWFPVWGAPGL